MSTQRFLIETRNITWKEADAAVQEAKQRLGKNASNQDILIAAFQAIDKSAYPQQHIEMRKIPVNIKNGLNVLAFLINILFRVDVGPDYPRWLEAAGEFGMFETILTPERQWFVIFDIIIFFQGLFACVQLLPKYRGTSLVQEGVGYWFIGATLLQLLGSILFSLDNFVGFCLSTVCVAGMVYSFIRILKSQEKEDVLSHSPEDYWLLRFPWSIQAGWFICILMLSVNSFFVNLGVGASIQLILTFLTFAAFAAIVIKFLVMSGNTPNYVIPSMIGLFCFGINSSLEEPGIEDNFGGWVLVLLLVTASLLSVGTIVAVAFFLYRNQYGTAVEDENQTIENSEVKDEYKGGEMQTEPIQNSIEMQVGFV